VDQRRGTVVQNGWGKILLGLNFLFALYFELDLLIQDMVRILQTASATGAEIYPVATFTISSCLGIVFGIVNAFFKISLTAEIMNALARLDSELSFLDHSKRSSVKKQTIELHTCKIKYIFLRVPFGRARVFMLCLRAAALNCVLHRS
jgi:hypothetical protein